MTQPDWSILIPTVPGRIRTFFPTILEQVRAQVGDRNIEILGLYDNKRRPVGAKRNALLSIASGRYCSFIDDDDRISDDYVATIHQTILDRPDADVIVYDHLCSIDGAPPYLCKYGIEYAYVHTPKLWTGKPSHTQTWRTSIAQRHQFPVLNVGEDVDWVVRASHDIEVQVRIDKVLYYYDCRTDVSETRGAGLVRDVRPEEAATWNGLRS